MAVNRSVLCFFHLFAYCSTVRLLPSRGLILLRGTLLLFGTGKTPRLLKTIEGRFQRDSVATIFRLIRVNSTAAEEYRHDKEHMLASGLLTGNLCRCEIVTSDTCLHNVPFTEK